MKRALIALASLTATAAAIVIWERSKWTHERDAQCASASSLIAAGAPRHQIIEVLGNASVEYRRSEWPEIERHFGGAPETEKLRDIRHRLDDRGRLLVYSRSNSIMFLYLNAEGRALHASCFLQ